MTTTTQMVRGVNIPINPKLPAAFDNTPNERRPKSQRRWWGRPFITTECNVRPTLDEENKWRRKLGLFEMHQTQFDVARAAWLKHWPGGMRYDVRCLDGGAWDRSTWKGSFGTLAEAQECARAAAAAGTYSDWPGASS